jgi:hypothetical protein
MHVFVLAQERERALWLDLASEVEWKGLKRLRRL